MSEINIKIIPAEETRFPSMYQGDYYYEKGSKGQKVIITATESGNILDDRLVALHELIEFILTDHEGILEEDILAFDQMFEKECDEGLHPKDAEPGDDPRAPYLMAHQFSTLVTRLMLNYLKLPGHD